MSRWHYGDNSHRRDARRVLTRFQRGLCAACIQPLDRPALDHDHSTGLVRGMLCGYCNFQENSGHRVLDWSLYVKRTPAMMLADGTTDVLPAFQEYARMALVQHEEKLAQHWSFSYRAAARARFRPLYERISANQHWLWREAEFAAVEDGELRGIAEYELQLVEDVRSFLSSALRIDAEWAPSWSRDSLAEMTAMVAGRAADWYISRALAWSREDRITAAADEIRSRCETHTYTGDDPAACQAAGCGVPQRHHPDGMLGEMLERQRMIQDRIRYLDSLEPLAA